MSCSETMAHFPLAFGFVALLSTSTFAQPQDQTVKVGPWTVATTYKADKFNDCTMSRDSPDGLELASCVIKTGCCCFSTRQSGS